MTRLAKRTVPAAAAARILAPALALGAFSGAALADFHKYKASSSLTTSVLNGGDRELTVLRFAGTTASLTGADFLHWGDGSLTNNTGSYGWSTVIPSDLTSSGSAYSVNPDRADNATPYTLEGSGGARLQDVFGPFGSGYKNMSYLLDGENSASWALDLYLDGQILFADNDSSTVELAILERGDDSNIRVRGIRADMSLTESANIARGNFASVGWSLNSLETSSGETVAGVGISLDSDWDNLIGFRFEADNGMNGPDLIGVGVTGLSDAGPATIPAQPPRRCSRSLAVSRPVAAGPLRGPSRRREAGRLRPTSANVRARPLSPPLLTLAVASSESHSHFDAASPLSNGAQTVVGLSLDSTWTNLIGFRLEAAAGMNGPDLIGVAVIPAPGSAALLGVGTLLAARRRRV